MAELGRMSSGTNHPRLRATEWRARASGPRAGGYGAVSKTSGEKPFPEIGDEPIFFYIRHCSELPVCWAFKGYAMYSRGGRMKLARPGLKRMQVQQRKPPPILPSTCIDVVNIPKLRRLA